jgi:hypothetical protein
MEPNKIPSIKTQIAIVKTLLDGSPKPQRKIAEEIGKEESTISKAIGYLKKAYVVDIVPQSIKSGGRSNTGIYTNNLCSLTYDLDHGIKIVLFFKSVLTLKFLKESETEDIINTLQKSDKIISMVADKEKELAIKKACLVNEKYNCKIKNRLQNIKITDDEINKEMEDFKEKLRISPLFFKICLEAELMGLNNNVGEITKFELEPPQDSPMFSILWDGLVMDSIFKTCVYAEYLQGIKNDDALEIVVKDNILHAKIKGRLEFIPIPASSLSS